MKTTWNILKGDVLDQLRDLPVQSVQCCVTSPPYWGLRDYGVDGQIGLEPTPQEYVEKMVAVFGEVRRVLRDDGTCWVNLGDSYNGSGPSGGDGKQYSNVGSQATTIKKVKDLKHKDLCGIPWRVALALQADGWYLRSDIIWAKPNPMPESVTDRPTKSHEYIFLLSKSERYFYDAEAIKEPLAATSIERLSQPTLATQVGSSRVPGKTNGPMKAVYRKGDVSPRNDGNEWNSNNGRGFPFNGAARNSRSVWTIATQSYAEAHFATFPEELPRRCIAAGSREGDTILDPFNGSGTTGAVAVTMGRNYIGIELNAEYIKLARRRIGKALKPSTFADPDASKEPSPLFQPEAA